MSDMVSPEKERVPFLETIYPTGSVEVWMGVIEDMMRKSVRHTVRVGLDDGEPPRVRLDLGDRAGRGAEPSTKLQDRRVPRQIFADEEVLRELDLADEGQLAVREGVAAVLADRLGPDLRRRLHAPQAPHDGGQRPVVARRQAQQQERPQRPGSIPH